MKTLICGLAVSLGLMATDLKAEIKVTVDGTEFSLSTLMENCQSMTGAPEVQVACFNALSSMLEEQNGEAKDSGVPIPEALDALRTAAQHLDQDSGLMISGTDCNIQVVYFNNYFHLSRRNVSTIDLFSAQFDVSKLQYDQIVHSQNAQAPLSKAPLADGATALMHGGVAMESNQHNFAPKSARASLADYAVEVVGQLSGTEDQSATFALVHPAKSQEADQIWTAFESLVKACQS